MSKNNKKTKRVANSSVTLKKNDSNINHNIVAKIIFIIMIFAFVGLPVAGLIAILFQ